MPPLVLSKRLNLALDRFGHIHFVLRITGERLYLNFDIADGSDGMSLVIPKHGSIGALLSMIHDKDRGEFCKHLHQALKSAALRKNAPYSMKVHLRARGQHLRHVEISGEIIEYDRRAKLIHMTGKMFIIDEQETSLITTHTVTPSAKQLESAILNVALDCIITINEHGEIISFNQAAESTFGYTSQSALGKKLADLIIATESQALYQQQIESMRAFDKRAAPDRRVELTAKRADDSTFPIELAIASLTIQNGSFLTAFIRDISESKYAAMLQLGQNRILNMIATGTSLTEILNEIERFAESQSACCSCQIKQINNSDIGSSKHLSSGPPAHFAGALTEFKASFLDHHDRIGSPNVTNTDLPNITATPLPTSLCKTSLPHVPQTCRSWPVFDKNNRLLARLEFYFCDANMPTAKEQQLVDICTHLAGIAIESRISEAKIRYLAHYDGLTSLPNRFLFTEYLDLALRNARRHSEKFAVLFLDLDKFKEINDSLGHDVGDYVLRETARRLRNCLRHTDKIARMGGDEFYILIEELRDGRYVADIAQKLLAEVARPILLGDTECLLSVSIGIAIYPDDGIDGATLIKNADSAMYRAKDKGKNAYLFYSAQNTQGGAIAAIAQKTQATYEQHPRTIRLN